MVSVYTEGMAGKRQYDRGLAARICERISEGEYLPGICASKGMPKPCTFLHWVAEDAEIERLYAHAREIRLQHMAEELVEIADDASADLVEIEKNGHKITVVDREAIQRSALRVDTRKWLLARLARQLYGDRTALEHSGLGGAPLVITVERLERPNPSS